MTSLIKLSVRQRIILVSLITLGIAISLTGPCYYSEDQDRDFFRASRLLAGDLGILLQGHETAMPWSHPGSTHLSTTLGGAFYLLMAPLLALSRSLSWLYTAIDGLILVGVIPFYYFARRVGSAAVAWGVAVIYVISSTRISCSNHAYHCFLALPFSCLLNIAILQFFANRSWKLGIGIALLAALCVSLHLSSLLTLVAGLLMYFQAHRLFGVFARFQSATRRIKLMALGVVGLGLVALCWGELGRRLGLRTLHWIEALGQCVGVWTPEIRPGFGPSWYGVLESVPNFQIHLKWVPDLGVMLVINALFIVIFLRGALWVWKSVPEDFGGVGHRAPLVWRQFKQWCGYSFVVHLLAMVGWGVELWDQTEFWTFLEYRYFVPVLPLILTIFVIGIWDVAGSLGSPAGRGLRFVSAFVLLFALHVAALVSGRITHPSRFSDFPVYNKISRIYAGIFSNIRIDQDEMFERTYLQASILSAPVLVHYPVPFRMPYLATVLHERYTNDSSKPTEPDEVLYIVPSGGARDRYIKETGVSLQADELPSLDLRLHRIRRSAAVILPLERGYEFNSWFEFPGTAQRNTTFTTKGSLHPTVASSHLAWLRPPGFAVPRVYLDLVMEETEHDLVVNFSAVETINPIFKDYNWYRDLGRPYLVVTFKDGQQLQLTAQAELALEKNQRNRYVLERIEGKRLDHVAGVSGGLQNSDEFRAQYSAWGWGTMAEYVWPMYTSR